jgi:hypothetical protein
MVETTKRRRSSGTKEDAGDRRHHEIDTFKESCYVRHRPGTRPQLSTRLDYNVHLNKRIMTICDLKELCDFVSTHAADFNHVNVCTAFRQVLKHLRGIPSKALAQALQTLEESAMRNMQDYEGQGIANTFHVIAKQGYQASGCLLLALEHRAETISGEFKAQEVANSCGRLQLWRQSLGSGLSESWRAGQRQFQGSSSRRR